MARTKQTVDAVKRAPVKVKMVANSKGKVNPTIAVEATVVTRKPHRYKPGTVALRDIRKLQKSTGMLSQHAPFNRMVREYMHANGTTNVKISRSSLELLQAIAENYMTSMLRSSNILAIHARRTTLMDKDIHMLDSVRSASIV